MRPITEGTIFVTGANGFVGRALCAQADALGYRVKAATRTPYDFAGNVQNILIPSLGMQSPQDPAGVCSLEQALQGVDTVVHLAARVHVMKESAQDAIGAYRAINVAGSLELAKAAIQAGVRRFIYISSIKVNGESTSKNHPFTAQDAPAPEDPYGLSKWEAEQALEKLAQQAGMELVIIRPPLVYGPGVGANFATMIKVLGYQLPLPLASINNLRSMVSVDNLVSLILTCARHACAPGQVFLVSDGQDVSLSLLLRKLIGLLKVRTWLFPVPSALLNWIAQVLGKGAVAQRLCQSLQVDIQATQEILQWNPPVTLDQGLQKTVQWYLNQ